ncbi:uncharacterized protein LOC130648900 [Hydractinia symbiolongicarpus]|uniref:uncharacterized protein LOC130648900 n=1 Tax=Hydractinia symbiolongicarpus TaxID=13093 RepID=UPI002549C5C6|nr:uncharacterized protein LOC130648900 [Hydractinia symbiolongicarpus]
MSPCCFLHRKQSNENLTKSGPDGKYRLNLCQNALAGVNEFFLARINTMVRASKLCVQDYNLSARKLKHLCSLEWCALRKFVRAHNEPSGPSYLGDNKFNKQEFLPVTSDLLKLKVYCEERTSFLVSALKDKHDDLSAWRELAEVVITRITVFNKRRGNEASSLLLKKYTERKNKTGTVHDDILKSLTPLERKLMNRLDLVHVRGKRGRQVPVLLLPDVVVAIDTLISTREAIGISDSNRFLFPTPSRGSKNPLRGYKLLQVHFLYLKSRNTFELILVTPQKENSIY